MQRIFLIAGLTASLIVNGQSFQGQRGDSSRTRAEVTQATVYFGYGAELTQQASVNVHPGTRFIVIDQLSTQVDINSLQISCPEEVALLSQRYNVFYPPLTLAPRNRELERLRDSIGFIQEEAGRVENLAAIEQEVLTKTGVLIEATLNGKGEGNMTAAEVLKMVDYYNARIERSKLKIFSYQLTSRQLVKRIDELRRKIQEMNIPEPAKPRPYGQLVLQVICKRTMELPVSLSYYTQAAGWTPHYDVRVHSKTNKVKLVYKASLTQSTGIDWKKVKLTLSTGTPNFGVAAPVLSPWYLQLYVPELYKALQGRAAGVNINRNTIQSFNNDQSLAEVLVTGLDGELVQQKKQKDTIDPSTLQQYTTLTEGQLNSNFEIDLPYDIDGDGQLHSVTIKEEEIACVLKNYAVPRADKESYLLAEVADWQNLDLLPGDANIIMDDTYIGKSIIDPNTTADTLNLSLGRDRRVVVKRSLVKELSSLKTSGGSNRQQFTYELVIKNNKVSGVDLLLKDQFPLSSIKEVEVKLEDRGDATVNEETGVLTWKISLKPGESKKVRFSYSVKYPRDKKIVNLK